MSGLGHETFAHHENDPSLSTPVAMLKGIWSVMVTFLFAILGLKIRRIEPEGATFHGIGGHRVGPTEHEVTVRGG